MARQIGTNFDEMESPVLAVTSPATEATHPDDQSQGMNSRRFEFYYPTWDTWKFRRTLSYWVAVLYLEGSILFTIGAGFSLLRKTNADGTVTGYTHPFGLVAVDGPYLIGGVCFTVGSLCGLLKVINVGNEGRLRWVIRSRAQWQHLMQYVSPDAVYIYSVYLIGALAFNVMTITPYIPSFHECCSYGGVSITAFIGGLCFVIAGVIECKHNNCFRIQLTSTTWWAAILNLVGGVFFLVAGFGYIFRVKDGTTWKDQTSFWVICFTYFVGSVIYWAGSFLALLLWKDEQYGLVAAPEINTGERHQEPSPEELAMHEQYGCGRSDIWQLPWLMMYLLNASASVLNVGFILLYHTKSQSGLEYYHNVMESFLTFLLSHGIMLLGSVIHHTPKAAPFSWLLIFMRCLLLLICINAWVLVVKNLLDHEECIWNETACPGHAGF